MTSLGISNSHFDCKLQEMRGFLLQALSTLELLLGRTMKFQLVNVFFKDRFNSSNRPPTFKIIGLPISHASWVPRPPGTRSVFV